MEAQIKCSLEEHKEINAIKYCPECKLFLFNKCENIHSAWLKSHRSCELKKDSEFFTGICKEKNHPNKLEYFCKDHNQLCCAVCIAKLNEKAKVSIKIVIFVI